MSHHNYCSKCGEALKDSSQFCSKCGHPVTTLPAGQGDQSPTGPQASTSSSQTQPKQILKGIDNRILIIVVIVLILIVPVFPRQRIVYVDGTTQTVSNSTAFSTSLQVYTQATQSQISVYTGTFQYFSGNYYNNFYNSYPGWGQMCTWWHNRILCNWNGYGYGNYASSYGTTLTVTPSMNVVSVTRTQQAGNGYGYGYGYGYGSGSGFLESLTLVYYNGQSQSYQNVYADNLVQSGVSSIPGTTVVTNTIVNTIVNPVTQTVPCQQCVPVTVTDHVSILQLLLGY